MMNILAAAFLMFLVMDPMGNIPPFLTVLRGISPKRRRTIILRELLIALLVLVFFLFFGQGFLSILRVSEPALTIAGGIILFLIAVRMIFSISEDMFGKVPDGEPFIVPLAIPLIAGPSAMTTVLLVTSRASLSQNGALLALVIAWIGSAIILLAASSLAERLGERVLIALERLMGMLLTMIAVEMFLSGVQHFWHAGG